MRRAVLAGFLLLPGSILAKPDHAAAARLRPFVTVGASAIRLSDLFSGLDAGQDCTLGPGPDPGMRIVLGQPQLQAIANEFGVAWAPAPGWQTVTLSRPGRTVDRRTVQQAIRTALTPLGLPPVSDLRLPGWKDLIVDPGSHFAVSTPSFDALSGHFSVDLSITVGDQETSRLHVEGVAIALANVAVPTRSIMEGEILTDADLAMTERPQDQVTGEPLSTISEGVGLEAVRPLVKGQPLQKAFLRPPPLVSRGSVVIMRLVAGGLSLSAEGEAIDTGAEGDRVRVVNTGSRAVLVGTVAARGEVEIDPDVPPMIVGNPANLNFPSPLFQSRPAPLMVGMTP